MRCYNHSDREAVGACKTCCKGLCQECAVDLGFGLACRGDHEKRVVEMERMIERAHRVQETARGNKYLSPAFLLFMGVTFSAYGFLYARSAMFVGIMGLGFLVYGLFVLAAVRRSYRRAAEG